MKRIGFVDSVHQAESAREHPEHGEASAQVRSWLDAAVFEAAIWTALGSNFETSTGRPFTVENAVAYLEALSEPAREQALKYAAGSRHTAPPQTRRTWLD